MGDGNNGAAAQVQGDQAARAAVTAGLQGVVGIAGDDAAARAQKNYKVALAERDARIADLE